jgi:hypothetical protein
MSDLRDRHELFDRHLRGELNESEMEQLAALLDSDPSARNDFVEFTQWDSKFTDVLQEADSGHNPPEASLFDAAINGSVVKSSTSTRRRTQTIAAVWLMLAITTLAIIALIGSFFDQRPISDPQIAKITGMSGSLQWTGDGGQIVRDLTVGAELPGGTIEALTPDSWFELEFKDGSTVAITGKSTLTFSDQGQKELHLKEGNLSSNIKPQPPGKPLLIHTRSAVLEVLGTQFEVEAGLSSTMLNVSKGKVRLKRLSDGDTVDVTAGQRVVATADRQLSPVRVPEAVNIWKSQLHRGSEGTYGKWLPATDQHAARLKAIPLVPRENPLVTLYMTGLRVSRVDGSPVILRPGSRFVVRGRIASTSRIFFGFKLAHANGEFAGKFRADQLSSELKGQREFEAVFRLNDFAIDPCVRDRKDELPSKPEGLVVTGVWCFTHNKSTSSGLEITEVELISPTGNNSE